MPGIHADHSDVTGQYAQKYKIIEELYSKGLLSDIPEEFSDVATVNGEVVEVVQSNLQEVKQQEGTNSWKAFLQKIIAEEKSKLNV